MEPVGECSSCLKLPQVASSCLKSLILAAQGLLREHIEELRNAVAKEQKGPRFPAPWAFHQDMVKGNNFYVWGCLKYQFEWGPRGSTIKDWGIRGHPILQFQQWWRMFLAVHFLQLCREDFGILWFRFAHFGIHQPCPTGIRRATYLKKKTRSWPSAPELCFHFLVFAIHLHGCSDFPSLASQVSWPRIIAPRMAQT